MAGNYPDVPGHRMAYDKDGTVVMDGVYQLSTGQVLDLNREYSSYYNCNSLCFIFPELRDLAGYYPGFGSQYYGFGTLRYYTETSVDTTSGIDGTWVALEGATNTPVGGPPTYRQSIVAIARSGIKAIRLGRYDGGYGSPFASSIHLFGTIAAGANPDRLALWHPTADTPIGPAYFDWGNVQRASLQDRFFRVKNLSPTFTANTVTVSTDAPSDTSPTVVDQHTLSNGAGFASTTVAGTLAPGDISSVLTLRRSTASNATLSVWALRVNAIAASWS